MKLINKTLIAVALAAASTVACADEMYLGHAKSGNSNAISIDVNSSGKAVGLQFKIKVPEGAVVDTASCLAGLKASAPMHAGVCKYNEAEHYVVGMVFSDTNEALPAGMLSIGTLTAKAKGNKGQNFEVMEFIAADINAKAIPSTSKMIREDESNGGNVQAK